jgi:hypothetical protein
MIDNIVHVRFTVEALISLIDPYRPLHMIIFFPRCLAKGSKIDDVPVAFDFRTVRKPSPQARSRQI